MFFSLTGILMLDPWSRNMLFGFAQKVCGLPNLLETENNFECSLDIRGP